MLHSIKAYLNYLYQSKNKHGLHSPFLFDYVTIGLSKNMGENLPNIKALKNQLISDKREISITDFGAGSKLMRPTKRKIADIASKAGMSEKRGKLLAQTVDYFKTKQILEIGTSLGISTAYLASGSTDANITTLEGCPETAKIAQENFDELGFAHIKVVVGKFEDTLDQVLKDQTFDLIFFDGNHQEKPTIQYFEKCLGSCHEDSILIFDDIHWSLGMEKAWNHIRMHKKVSLSVDTFKWGLIFFRKGKVKEHITLRI